jgi:GrpB-like predicted nucleotidyltransferase (UPF0157 family)
MPVEVVPYNPEWKDWFEELTKPLWDNLGDSIVDVVHVGSTSIVGMSAKPVIDIDIVIDDWAKFPQIVNGLKTLSYTHVGDLGINERETFKLETTPKHRHNLYVCHKDSTAYRNHVLLKKHLNENPTDFQRYINLKLELAESSIDVDLYCRSKTDLILEFLRSEGLTEKELEEIRAQNLS